ncbi:unnamed protein product [Heligmosomoides polygyrus]|uniref:Uncharacterized protein n=1 Tax=Heligmosomoides polygyrus TaxID=6339 RepID=A0A183G497_HELPZ|nr:unnamed protein product [Heligmosomoides polygyrus]
MTHALPFNSQSPSWSIGSPAVSRPMDDLGDRYRSQRYHRHPRPPSSAVAEAPTPRLLLAPLPWFAAVVLSAIITLFCRRPSSSSEGLEVSCHLDRGSIS